MALESDLDWTSVKFVFYDTGSNAKNNLCTLLKFIDQRFVYFIIMYIYKLYLYLLCVLTNTYLIIFFLFGLVKNVWANRTLMRINSVFILSH